MPYARHSDADRAHMLATIGVDSLEELFADIPAAVRVDGLDLPEPEPEQQRATRLEWLAGRNRVDLMSFLGAGAYRHYIPVVVDEIIRRGEFLTAYTPYQPEVSQGTLQAIWEYQSLIAQLTGLDVVSASHYDGSTATAEAALMAIRQTKRERVLISRAVHPHFRKTTETYFSGRFVLDEIPVTPAGSTDLEAMERMLADGDVAGVAVAQPNFFGALEDMAAATELAHAAGALAIAVVEPTSLAVLSSPAEYGADIAAGEGQPLGIPLQYGGPYLGILAATEKLMRQIPGRLIGRTRDVDGKRAYVMTIRAREQDIRREKAASNICTNQSLCALAATVYLSVIGPTGLHDVVTSGVEKARELERALAAAGAPRTHSAPYLNEFAIRVPDAQRVHAELIERGVLAGVPLANFYDEPELADSLLVCATEVTTADEIAGFAAALKAVRA